MDILEYNDSCKEDRGALNNGRLKITNSQIIFKNHKTGKVETLVAADISSVAWQRMALDFCLRVMMDNGQVYRFGGFAESDYEKLSKFVSRNYQMDLEKRDFCLKGWNWGVASFDGAVLNFDVGKSGRAFEVPLYNVGHCATAKNEVTLEFQQNDDAPVSLMEMRFHIPAIDGIDKVQDFLDNVLKKASIIKETGDAIATFKELQCLTPRGRYDIKIFPSFIQLHGKTFDYKIPITSILRLFQLPHKDSRQMFFVMSLDPPIKQGQTRYHYLILLFTKDEEVLIELGLTEKEIRDKYEGKLQKEMQGYVYEVLAKLMKVLVQRKITIPDPGFCSPKDVPVITCSYRASAGLLYPLDRGFMYVHKPPIHIRFEEIMSINFARSGGSTRSFDFEVETKSGFVHTFSSIEKEEYSKLFDFVSKKKLRVKNRGTETAEKGRKDRVNDEIVDSDLEDDEPDAYLERVREEGRIRTEGGDSDDESDVSFNPGGESDDVAEEFDSNASGSSSEDSDEEGSPKKKKPEKEKPKKEKEKKKKEHKEKKHRPKKDKDENRPKRPQSAYFLWMNENRESLKKKHPDLSIIEITKKAGELWKEVKDKTKWELLAVEAKKKYEKEMAEYKEKGPSSPKEKSSKKSDKSKSTPKKSKSPTKTVSQGSNKGFKSKEYISDSDSSSSDESAKKSKKKQSSKKDKKAKSSKKKAESDIEMKSDAASEESAASTPASDEDSD